MQIIRRLISGTVGAPTQFALYSRQDSISGEIGPYRPEDVFHEPSPVGTTGWQARLRLTQVAGNVLVQVIMLEGFQRMRVGDRPISIAHHDLLAGAALDAEGKDSVGAVERKRLEDLSFRALHVQTEIMNDLGSAMVLEQVE